MILVQEQSRQQVKMTVSWCNHCDAVTNYQTPTVASPNADTGQRLWSYATGLNLSELTGICHQSLNRVWCKNSPRWTGILTRAKLSSIKVIVIGASRLSDSELIQCPWTVHGRLIILFISEVQCTQMHNGSSIRQYEHTRRGCDAGLVGRRRLQSEAGSVECARQFGFRAKSYETKNLGFLSSSWHEGW